MLSTKRPFRIFSRRDGISKQLVCWLLLLNSLFWIFLLRRNIRSCFTPYMREKTSEEVTRRTEQIAGIDVQTFEMTLKDYHLAYKMTVPKKRSCRNTTVFMAIMSTGDKSAHIQRNALRNTYLKEAARFNIEYKFFVGFSNTTRQDLLLQEMQRFDDVVFINMMDTYANNTIKWNAMYQYHEAFCREAFFFMKVDDDVIVHIPRLWQWIERDFGGIIRDKSHWLICQGISGVKPIREKTSKWYVPISQFPKDWYPPYCNGYAVIMPTETSRKLLHEAKNHKFLKQDDVFFTGIVTEALNISVNHFAGIGGDFEIDICRGNPPFQTVIHTERRPKTIYAKYYKLDRCGEIAKQLGNATVIPHVDYEG